MKLRIRGSSIRLRLTQGEVADLAAKGRIEEATVFGGGERFGYALVASAGATSVGARFVGGAIEVTVPAARARAWAASDEVGIEGEDGALRIAIEKDFKCLTPRTGEDDADAFPNPNESC
jgi:hypothetical protein